MSRYYHPTTMSQFKKLVQQTIAAHREQPLEQDQFFCLARAVQADLKVEFDCENTSLSPQDFGPEPLMGYRNLGNGLVILGCCAGGDWEFPVYFAVYWDGKKLRAYIPREGNPWNTQTKRAFGNDDEADLRNARQRWPDYFTESFDDVVSDCLDFDPKAILKDIRERLLPRPETDSRKPTDRTTQEGTPLLVPPSISILDSKDWNALLFHRSTVSLHGHPVYYFWSNDSVVRLILLQWDDNQEFKVEHLPTSPLIEKKYSFQAIRMSYQQWVDHVELKKELPFSIEGWSLDRVFLLKAG